MNAVKTPLPLSMFTDWLACGERGLSSEAIVERLTGRPVGRYPSRLNYPHDPGDLGRCVRLLDAHPIARASFPVMASVSPEWAALVEVWDELEALLREEEAENTGYARRTYARMREVIVAAQRQGGRT